MTGPAPGDDRRQDHIPAPGSPEWDAFTTGYEAGITHGITIGRDQVHAEEWPVWAQFAAHVRALAKVPGPLEHNDRMAWIRQRQEQACWHPGWTPQQIRDHARASWIPARAGTATRDH